MDKAEFVKELVLKLAENYPPKDTVRIAMEIAELLGEKMGAVERPNVDHGRLATLDAEMVRLTSFLVVSVPASLIDKRDPTTSARVEGVVSAFKSRLITSLSHSKCECGVCADSRDLFGLGAPVEKVE